MNVRVNDSTTEFQRVTITIDITSREELATLWHRLDVGALHLVKRYGNSNPRVEFPSGWEDMAIDSAEPLFKAVDQLAVSRGLRAGGRVGHR